MDRCHERERMVANQVAGRGVRDPDVLRAMRRVPREHFVPESLSHRAYHDDPLPIGMGATISQPYIVGASLEAAGVAPGMRVLDVGTGSGYQAAVLAELGASVFSIERVPALLERARTVLCDWPEVRLRHGDGYAGWPEHGPYDAIVVAAAAPTVPQALMDQLVLGGRLVIPVGSPSHQELIRLEHTPLGFKRQGLMPVLFVDLIPGVAEGT